MLDCFNNNEQKQKDKEIEKQLKKDYKQSNKVLKLLLLGTGGSGKSTIFKQMRIIHKGGYSSKEDRLQFKDVVFDNILTSIRALINGMSLLNIEFQNPSSKTLAEQIMSIPQDQIALRPGTLLTPAVGKAVKELWKDKGIQECYEKSAAFQLNDSTDYFLNDLDRIIGAEYVPSVQDILRSRVKTVGIVEADFTVKNLQFKMVDVGGQRNERRKWIHVFDGVTAIIFVTALSEYDQVLEEDETMNRMRESILLFDEIANCRYFKKTSIIIFFNKYDLFEKKIKKVDLTTCFPDYTGGKDSNAGFNFIKKKFIDTNKFTKKRQIYAHHTTATDTENIKKVFNYVKDILLRDNMRNFEMT